MLIHETVLFICTFQQQNTYYSCQFLVKIPLNNLVNILYISQFALNDIQMLEIYLLKKLNAKTHAELVHFSLESKYK